MRSPFGPQSQYGSNAEERCERQHDETGIVNRFGFIAAGTEREPQPDYPEERCHHGKREPDCDSHLPLLPVNVMRDTRGENGLPEQSAQGTFPNHWRTPWRCRLVRNRKTGHVVEVV